MSASLLILIPLLPLLGFLINGLGFPNIPKGAVGIIGTLAVVASFVLSVMTFNAFLASGSQPLHSPAFRLDHRWRPEYSLLVPGRPAFAA
jgi:NADH-quinone oxidoreductase subunit L